MKLSHVFSANNLACVLLFFCIPFIAAFYTCATKEYDLNQQIDRGFISRNAVFFSFKSTNSNQLPISGNNPETDSGNKDQTGTILDVLQLEKNETYFIASQQLTTRAVYYQGNPELPPLVSGRFFTIEECLSDQKLAVIGQNQIEKTWMDTKSNKTFITLLDEPYEVIGIAGLNVTSTIDDLAFVNFGSVAIHQGEGRFYLDGTSNVTSEYYKQIVTKAQELGFSDIHEINMPTTATDIIAGGVFMANILHLVIITFLIGASICILVLFLLTNRQKISVYLLNGYNYKYTAMKIFRPCFFSGIIGVTTASLALVILGQINFFALPQYTQYLVAVGYLLLTIGILVLWTIPLYFMIRRFNVAESLR